MRKYVDISQRDKIPRASMSDFDNSVELCPNLWHWGLDGSVYHAPVNQDLNSGGPLLGRPFLRPTHYADSVSFCHVRKLFAHATANGEPRLIA